MKVLFVCLGNICRSPTAHGVFRAIAAREAPGLITEVDSAGTADYHIGDPPDPRTCRVAAQRGYDLSDLRARQLEREDFSRYDLLLAMDRANLIAMQSLAPAPLRPRASLFLEFACGGQHPVHGPLLEVPDPYYGGEADFLRVVDLVEHASRSLIDRLREGRSG